MVRLLSCWETAKEILSHRQALRFYAINTPTILSLLISIKMEVPTSESPIPKQAFLLSYLAMGKANFNRLQNLRFPSGQGHIPTASLLVISMATEIRIC